MKISDILTRNPQIIHPGATICEAARKMKRFDVGMLPVCENSKVIGAITDRDIAIRAVADGADPLTTKVREVMSSEISCCHEDDALEEAVKIMESERIRRLPVLDGQDQLVGIISVADLAVRSHTEHFAEEVLEHLCVKS